MKTLMVLFGVNILPSLDYPPVEYPPVQNVQKDPALAERYFKERIGIGPYQCALPGEAYIGNACQRLSGGPDRFRDMFRRDRMMTTMTEMGI